MPDMCLSFHVLELVFFFMTVMKAIYEKCSRYPVKLESLKRMVTSMLVSKGMRENQDEIHFFFQLDYWWHWLLYIISSKMLQKQLSKQLRFYYPELSENKLVRKHDEGKKRDLNKKTIIRVLEDSFVFIYRDNSTCGRSKIKLAEI